MSDKDKDKLQNQPAPGAQAGKNEEMHLDDERRVKVLSPGRLVFKRFMRNRLAIIGTVLLVLMFLFSFVGGMLTPYGETQTFYKQDVISRDFAAVTENTNFRYTLAQGREFNSMAQAAFVLASTKGEPLFESRGELYYYQQFGSSYAIYGGEELATVPANVQTALEAARVEGETEFELDGNVYTFEESRLGGYTVYAFTPVTMATYWVYDMADESYEASYGLVYGAELAMFAGEESFTADGNTYTLTHDEEGVYSIWAGGEQYANISHFIVQPAAVGVFLSIDFKTATVEAVSEGLDRFTYPDENGEDEEFTITRKDREYTIRNQQEATLIDTYASPSAEHPLGTDGNGMDMLTRLMYGGRISLMIGFVVVLFELLLGILMGGLAGYFGKWVDMLVMRVVDVVDCMPMIPLVLIMGTLMDAYQVDARTRIFYLMIILGLLYWTSPARIVRAQILSLREQEFMIATEATGLPVWRRIMRHLIPNVMPQLIVIITLNLGSVILLESTLSFLGMGVKYPFATWGNIANAVNNAYVMTTYLFVWVPAGILLLLTVLGFNFVGDGLRDAFDPKMKR